MPVDARRARQKRRGKADRLAAGRKKYLEGTIELRCPHCNSREVAFHRTRGTVDQYGCGKCWKSFSVDATRNPRKGATP